MSSRPPLRAVRPHPDDEQLPPTMTVCPYCEPYGGRGLVPYEVRAEFLKSPVVSEREIHLVTDEPGDEPPGAA